MDKMILGRYIPGNSLIHRLDPRSKLLSMFLFVLIIFWANNLATNLLLFVFTFFLIDFCVYIHNQIVFHLLFQIQYNTILLKFF